MEHQVKANGPFHRSRVVLKTGLLNTAQAGGGAAQAGVTAGNVIIVQFTPADASLPMTLEPVIEIFFVSGFLDTKAFAKPCIVQSPSNIIVAAEVV